MAHPLGPAALEARWLEAVLREGEVLPRARVRGLGTQIIGVGYGLDGTSARVTLDGDDVPDTVVVKWSPAENARREACFYRHIAPHLDVRLATLLGARMDAEGGRGVLVLSDVAPARQGDTIVGATASESDALVDTMARLHAPFWGGGRLPDLAAVPMWARDGAGQAARVLELLPPFLAAWEGRLPAAALRCAAALPPRLAAASDRLAQSPATLVHADLHLDNVLFLADGTPVVLDWPSACRGPAALDLARLLVEGMPSAARRERQERLMLRYLAALAACGVDCDRDRLRTDLVDVAVLLFAAAIRWATGPHGRHPDVPRVERIMESLVRRTADAVTDSAP